jgi:hypothetical protein
MAEQGSEEASKAASKVQEAAANVRQARSGGRRRIAKTGAEAVARRYFEAIGARDLDTAVGLWAETYWRPRACAPSWASCSTPCRI